MTEIQLEKIAWLNRAFHAETKLKSLKYRLEKLRENAKSVMTCYDLKDTGKSSSHINGTYENYMNIAEIEEEYNSYLLKYNQMRQEIKSAIDSLDDPELETILTYRHLDYMSINEISAKMNYSRSSINRKRKIAIKKLTHDDT